MTTRTFKTPPHPTELKVDRMPSKRARPTLHLVIKSDTETRAAQQDGPIKSLWARSALQR